MITCYRLNTTSVEANKAVDELNVLGFNGFGLTENDECVVVWSDKEFTTMWCHETEDCEFSEETNFYTNREEFLEVIKKELLNLPKEKEVTNVTANVVQTNTNLSISELTDLIYKANVEEKRKISVKNDKNNEQSYRAVCGVGVVKEKPKNKLEQVSYDTWVRMLKRCYENKSNDRNKSYVDCFVTASLLDFNTFYLWCSSQVGFNSYDEKGKRFVLDKDILVKGNKLYSEDTCCFVPHEINTLILKSEAIRGNYPIGVHKRGDRFCSRCKVNNKDKFLGYTQTAEEAFYAYKKFKENHIKEVANKWKDQIDPKVYNALMNYQIEITD